MYLAWEYEGKIVEIERGCCNSGMQENKLNCTERREYEERVKYKRKREIGEEERRGERWEL